MLRNLFNEQRWWPPVLLCAEMGIRTGTYVDYYRENDVPLFANYDLLICNTRRHYSVFDWHPNCHYVPWGTDTELFAPQRAEQAPDRPVRFFQSVGMAPKRKGTDYLLKAFSLLEGEARLVLHTQVDVAESFPQMADLVGDLEHDGRLVLRRETVAAPGLYHLGDVYVYPSRLDGIGLSLAEAMACGLPAIVSDCPPMNEFVPGEPVGRRVKIKRLVARRDGYYWPQCLVDDDDLLRHMQWFVVNRARLPAIKADARQHAVANLDWSRNASRMPALFENTTPIPDELREPARKAAEKYEARRATIWETHPRLAHLVYPFWRRLQSRPPAAGDRA